MLRYRFKAGLGKIEKIGESPFEASFEIITFKPPDHNPVTLCVTGQETNVYEHINPATWQQS